MILASRLWQCSTTTRAHRISACSMALKPGFKHESGNLDVAHRLNVCVLIACSMWCIAGNITPQSTLQPDNHKCLPLQRKANTDVLLYSSVVATTTWPSILPLVMTVVSVCLQYDQQCFCYMLVVGVYHHTVADQWSYNWSSVQA